MIFLAIADPPLTRVGNPPIQADDIEQARAHLVDWVGEDKAREVTLVPQVNDESEQ